MEMFRVKNMTMRLLLVLVALFTLNACTRNDVKKSTDASFTLKLPENKALMAADEKVAHIVVNVRGPGIGAPIIWNWDSNCHCAANTMSDPPPAVYMEVPSGPDRLIQVLVVYQNQTTDAYKFSYGDTVASLAPGFQPVGILLQDINQGGSGADSDVIGRFVDASGVGPTGIMVEEFQPPVPGRPAVEIQRSGIYSGWFRGFIIDGAPFRYVLQPGNVVLFNSIKMSGNTILADGATLSTGPNLMKVAVPEHYRSESGGGGPAMFKREEAIDLFVGWFGPGAGTAKKVCKSSTPATIPYIYPYAAATPNPSPSPTNLGWDYTGADSSKARVVAGGVDVATCNGTNFVDHVNFMHGQLGNGRDGALGFQGPFVKQYQSGYYNTVLSNGSGISWLLLPGVTEGISGVAGFTLYVKEVLPGAMMGGDSGLYGNHGMDNSGCDKRAERAGYSRVEDIGSGSSSYTFTNLPPTGGFNFALCPYSAAGGRMYFPDVASGYIGNYGGGGGGSPGASGSPMASPSPYTQITWQGQTSGHTGACVPIRLELRTASGGTSGFLDVMRTVNLTPGALGYFYKDQDCVGGQVTSTNFMSGGSGSASETFFYKNSGSSGVTIGANDVTGSPPSGPLSPASVGFNVIPGGSADHFGLIGPLIVKQYNCQTYILQVQDSANIPITWGGSSGSSSITLPAGAIFYTDSDCINVGSPSLPFSGPTTNRHFAARFVTTGTGMNITSTALTSPNVTAASVNSLEVQTANPASRVEFYRNMGMASENQCVSIRLHQADTYGGTVDGTAQFDITADSGQFYTTSACSAGLGPVLTAEAFTGGAFIKSFWYKKGAVGSTMFNITNTGALQGSSMSMMFNPGPHHVALLGPPMSSASTCYTLQVELQDNANNPVNADQNYNVTVNASTGGYFYPDGSCSTGQTGIANPTINMGGSSGGVLYYKYTTPPSGTVNGTVSPGVPGPNPSRSYP